MTLDQRRRSLRAFSFRLARSSRESASPFTESRADGRSLIADSSIQSATSNPFFLLKTSGIGKILRKELAPGGGQIEVAFIFGSFAQGTERPESDVDLIVIGDISGRELAQLLIPAKEAMGREINPITMTPSELRKKAQGGHAFPKRVLGEPMIFLIGGEDELRDVSDGGPPPSASDLAD